MTGSRRSARIKAKEASKRSEATDASDEKYQLLLCCCVVVLLCCCVVVLCCVVVVLLCCVVVVVCTPYVVLCVVCVRHLIVIVCVFMFALMLYASCAHFDQNTVCSRYMLHER
ncbi:hypothetical protein ADUPG1_003254, partial [Aduncisulcus paluster]